MAHKRRVHSAIAIELFFEGKNYQRFVDVLAQQLDAPLPPRPELRADVVNHRNAALAHLPRHAPVEGRSVDDDGHRWALLIDRAKQFPIQPKNLRQTAKNLSDADDGKVFRINNDLASRRPHALPARAEKFKLQCLRGGGAEPCHHTSRNGRPPPQRFNQLRAIHFARGFAGGDQNSHGSIVTGRRKQCSMGSAFAGADATRADAGRQRKGLRKTKRRGHRHVSPRLQAACRHLPPRDLGSNSCSCLLLDREGHIHVRAVRLGSEGHHDGALGGFVFTAHHASNFSIGAAGHIRYGKPARFQSVPIK